MLNQSEPNVILTAHATKVNRPEPNWTEPQTCLAGRNHALSRSIGPHSICPNRFRISILKLVSVWICKCLDCLVLARLPWQQE